MRAVFLMCILSSVLVGQLSAQSFETDSVSQSEILKLQFIIGKWKGNGWMIGADGKKSEFEQTENIQFKLDSTLILIEGFGQSNGKIIHNAMAIISYNQEYKNYTFQSYLQNGRKGEFKAEVINDSLYWYPYENMRYIITINEKGQWFEIGEMQRNNDWFRFFEMSLDRSE